jgi:hypothetical protein
MLITYMKLTVMLNVVSLYAAEKRVLGKKPQQILLLDSGELLESVIYLTELLNN